MKYIIAVLLLLATVKASAQNKQFAREIIDSLTGKNFWGRGYTNGGMATAARFIAAQFSTLGVTPIGESYFQPFTFPVNTFPGRMEVSINNKKLTPGRDFIVTPDSRGVHATGKLEQKDSTHFVNPNYRIIVTLHDKLTWSVAPVAADYTGIQLDRKFAGDVPFSIQADIESKLVQTFTATNVCGWIKGTRYPDSIIVISAHYDHLGGMGEQTYFPGANDNASGTALLLSLARYYSKNPQPYSIAFIAFAGEEAGLLGSKHFTEKPLFPLENIRFLLNLDLVGTGEEGATVVNATEYPAQFKTLTSLNDSAHLLFKINARGKAANSDHYWFSERGVPAFFLYTLGGIKAYHDINDKGSTLPLTEFDDLFTLIVEFNKSLMN